LIQLFLLFSEKINFKETHEKISENLVKLFMGEVKLKNIDPSLKDGELPIE